MHQIFNERSLDQGAKHQAQTEIINVYNDILPAEYDDYFPEEAHKHLVNTTRQSWDDQAGLASQVFSIYFQPENESAKAKQRAEKREHICYGYNDAGLHSGGIDMTALAYVRAWYLIGCAEAVLTVCPDFHRKTPYFDWRDPRTHFMPVGYSPWKQRELDETLFAYQSTLGELKQRYPGSADALSQAHTQRIYDTGPRTTGWNGRRVPIIGTGNDEDRLVWVGEFYAKDAWYVATLEENSVVLVASETGDKHHPDICPVVAYSLFNAMDPRSMLAGQVSMMAAMSRILSQRIDFNDHVLYPGIFTTPIVGGNVKYGPGAVNVYDTANMQGQPRTDIIQPRLGVDSEATMGTLMALTRVLNRNPEAMQGGGNEDSAKAMAESKGALNTTIQRTYWPSFKQGDPKLYSKAMRMDISLWGAERKEIAGRTPDFHRKERGIMKSVAYRPIQDLKGFEDKVKIETGTLLEGYNGLLELMQQRGAGMISLDTVLEKAQVINDPQGEKRRIQTDQMEGLLWADLTAKAESGKLQPGAMSKVRDLMQQDNVDLFDAIAQLSEQGALEVEPQAPEGMPGMPPGMGGAPPDLLGAADALSGGAPSLELIQGMGG